MKTQVFVLIIISGLIPLLTKGGSPEPSLPAGPYTEVKKDMGITIYSRWVRVSETVSTRQIKAIYSCNADPEDALTVLRDDNSFHLWMNGTSVYSRMKTMDERNWYSYVRYGLPWPLKDMDCILNIRIEELKDGSGIRVLATGVPNYMKCNEGVARISHLECEWIIRKSAWGGITIEYIQFSKQPSKYPRWLADPIVQKSLINSMNAFRNRVEKSHNLKSAKP